MTSSAFLSQIGEQAATGGFTAVAAQDLDAVLMAGRAQELSPILLDLLADEAELRVRRLRALSRLLILLERTATSRLADSYAHAA